MHGYAVVVCQPVCERHGWHTSVNVHALGMAFTCSINGLGMKLNQTVGFHTFLDTCFQGGGVHESTQDWGMEECTGPRGEGGGGESEEYVCVGGSSSIGTSNVGLRGGGGLM